MVMKRDKLNLGIFISVLFIAAAVFGVFHLRERECSMPETNGTIK